MSPRQSPAEIGQAAVQWACTRRGRTLVLSLVLLAALFGFATISNREAIASQYRAISSTYSFRPYLPHMPSIIHSPFNKPSNTTVRLENGELAVVPQALKKTTPNFHLVLPSSEDTDAFCKTTLSAMILNYPPPTVVDLYQEYKDEAQAAKNTLASIRHYLSNDKFVHDDDLMLIVHGKTSWFQLPSDVIVKQYVTVLEEANARLLAKYGVDENRNQKFNQSIVFGADKLCSADEMACKFAPPSILPSHVYRDDENSTVADRPARYINSQMVMGPAKDLRVLYQAALRKLNEKHSQAQSVQSVFATLFAEQQLRRDAEMEQEKPATAKIKDLFAGIGARSSMERELKEANVTLSNTTQYEFSIGLDYTHTLFQPIKHSSEDELVSVLHDNSTDLSALLHPSSWAQYLSLPVALGSTNPPFWRPDFAKHNPSPNEKPAFIKPLDFDSKLDDLPKRKTSWARVPLVQNTYTGAVPAIIQTVPTSDMLTSDKHQQQHANITWNDMWYSPFRRALLRNYFRTPQSPTGYHNSLVGGDRAWDMRGGRGGVWTETEQAWMPWGEVDGVCGTLNQLKEVFHDGQGVWLHEKEDDGENKRIEEEMELAKKLQEDLKKEVDAETEANVKKIKQNQEAQRKQDKAHQKADKERLEKLKKIDDEKKKQEDERKKQAEEAAKKAEDAKKKIEDDKKKKDALDKQHSIDKQKAEQDQQRKKHEQDEKKQHAPLSAEQERERKKQEDTANHQLEDMQRNRTETHFAGAKDAGQEGGAKDAHGAGDDGDAFRQPE